MAAKTKKAAQPAKEAPAKTKKGEERKWDSSKGYTGTQSSYKPPDTDPALTQVRHGDETK